MTAEPTPTGEPLVVAPTPTIVLIPGAGGDARYWDRVVPHLADAGYAAIAVELPAGDDAAGIPEYVDIVVAAVGDRRRLVVVAQSMGSYTAAALCDRMAVEMLVFVAAMIPLAGETAGEWWTATGQVRAKRDLDLHEGRDPDGPFDPVVTFFHDLGPDALGDVMAAGESPQSATPFSSPFTATAWRSVPTRAVIGSGDRLFPPRFMRTLVRTRLGIEPDVVDAGHLIAMARPNELASLILDYVAQAERPPR
ncbi:alpha/beta fold hydrolase [Marisediminicola senii]|uniref:alpha/beta fold hydrolase n=1 Tax=Marisediminicola senii TaxID=2711233 RepID=UPI00191436FD|nr:alpha/beta fold hydrolase [Marisediminicola senii]